MDEHETTPPNQTTPLNETTPPTEPPRWDALPPNYAPTAPWTSAMSPSAPVKQSAFRRHPRLVAGLCAGALVLVLGGGGVAAYAAGRASTTTATSPTTTNRGSGGFGGGSGFGGSEQGGSGTTPGGTYQGGTGTTSASTAATAAQEVGLVTITSTIDYTSSEVSEGTGMVLTANGEVLTNNHVVEGATTISVTVVSTGKTYTATVVGTDSTDDIAVIKLTGASGLKTVTISSAAATVGQSITDIGNAQGTGKLVAATGTVTDTEQSITVSDDLTDASKSLSGLLEIDADVVPGDSGGPIVNSAGRVVGIATAASSGSTDVTGYAIPIATATAIVKQIEAGDASGTVTIGLPAFLGVTIAQNTATTTGVPISGTVAGSAAAGAGLVNGDIITAVNGVTVSTQKALSAAVAAHSPGDHVSVTYTDVAGASHTVAVTLGEGPAA